MKLTVAIVTARQTEHTRWADWYDRVRTFLRGEWNDPIMNGEFGALLASLAPWLPGRHLNVQLAALALQTVPPDEVIIVHRGVDLGDDPVYSSPRLTGAARGYFSVAYYPATAAGPMPRGNADKNLAIASCQTEALVMLDDCCIPSFAFCELALEACQCGEILQPTHVKVHLPVFEDTRCAVSTANVYGDEGVGRRVFGIWAMPVEHIRAVGGYNTKLDGKHGLWDEELLLRMDRYVAEHGLCYSRHPRTRIYEIEHDRPWAAAGDHDANALAEVDRG